MNQQLTQPIVYGYRNTHTGILWHGYYPIFDALSDPMDRDNQGRLTILGNDPVHGRLDWERITDADQWERLTSQEDAAIFGDKKKTESKPMNTQAVQKPTAAEAQAKATLNKALNAASKNSASKKPQPAKAAYAPKSAIANNDEQSA